MGVRAWAERPRYLGIHPPAAACVCVTYFHCKEGVIGGLTRTTEPKSTQWQLAEGTARAHELLELALNPSVSGLISGCYVLA